MNTPFSPPPLPEKPKRSWVFPVVLITLLCLPVLIALVSYACYRRSGSSAVERLEARIKQRGEPLTLADLAATYPPIPDKDNGAVLLLDEWEKESPEFWKAFRRGEMSLPERSDPRLDAALPFRSVDAKDIPRAAALDQTNITVAETFLEEQQEHLDAVRMALRYNQFRFPIQITNGFSMLLPHLSETKREAQNFRIVGLLAVERGNVDAALDALEDTARVGKALASEPCLISQLVRIACYSMVLEDMERLLSRQSLSAGQLERISVTLEQLRMPGALRSCFLAERASDVSVFNMPAKAIGQITASGGDESDTSAARGYRIGMNVLSATGLKDADKRLMLETMEEAISLADRDDPKAIERCEELFRNTALAARKFPPKIFSAMLLPALEKVPAKFAALEARRRAATVAVAVERYRLTHNGNLPETLDNLVPQFLPAIPKDPFDGQSIRFHPLETGFVVYSVGRDRVDHGGKERPKKGSAKDFDETFVIER